MENNLFYFDIVIRTYPILVWDNKTKKEIEKKKQRKAELYINGILRKKGINLTFLDALKEIKRNNKCSIFKIIKILMKKSFTYEKTFQNFYIGVRDKEVGDKLE